MVIFDGQIKHLPVPASDDPAHFGCDGDAWGYSVIFETPVRIHKNGASLTNLSTATSAAKASNGASVKKKGKK
jgi:hypothetical protein